MVQGEPDYGDQVLRLEQYAAAHPETEVVYMRPFWQAVIREGDDGLSQTIITRPSLGKLLDTLQSL